ncbi:hypothetical protein VSDG_02782 [Cytospora chrysosperma]|uniref:Uncharacterized protein n=1 Tax=Cytospora chrysosperma TaxID=252740 RepID=A0A423WCI9_CYTCH|nr:hypothetical protein VSDG_02782 [Valsa sordida]
MPRKMDNDTRIHFRTYEASYDRTGIVPLASSDIDEAHAQKRAFCLHCNKDACADNIQRMKNHLLKCEAYLNSNGGEPSFAFDLDGPIAPDTPMSGIPGPPAVPGSANGGEGSSQQDPSVAGTPGMGPPTANMGPGTPVTPSAAMVKASQDSLNKVRTAMARSTKRLESLESVLKTQIQDGMHNAATHVRAAIRDERDRLFKLSQTLVKQEMKVRDAQAAIGVPM